MHNIFYSLRILTGGGGELESGGEGEEGTSSSEHHRFPKKASHSAMTMNTRDTIEQTRMEDIYFTSEYTAIKDRIYFLPTVFYG